MGSGALCNTLVVNTVGLQIIAFCLFVSFTQRPNVFGLGWCCHLHKVSQNVSGLSKNKTLMGPINYLVVHHTVDVSGTTLFKKHLPQIPTKPG